MSIRRSKTYRASTPARNLRSRAEAQTNQNQPDTQYPRPRLRASRGRNESGASTIANVRRENQKRKSLPTYKAPRFGTTRQVGIFGRAGKKTTIIIHLWSSPHLVWLIPHAYAIHSSTGEFPALVSDGVLLCLTAYPSDTLPERDPTRKFFYPAFLCVTDLCQELSWSRNDPCLLTSASRTSYSVHRKRSFEFGKVSQRSDRMPRRQTSGPVVLRLIDSLDVGVCL